MHNELGGAKKLIANRGSENDNQSMTFCYISIPLSTVKSVRQIQQSYQVLSNIPLRSLFSLNL